MGRFLSSSFSNERIDLVAVRPSICGISISMKMISGSACPDLRISMASLAELAVLASKSCSSTSPEMTFLLIALSSTISAFIFASEIAGDGASAICVLFCCSGISAGFCGVAFESGGFCAREGFSFMGVEA